MVAPPRDSDRPDCGSEVDLNRRALSLAYKRRGRSPVVESAGRNRREENVKSEISFLNLGEQAGKHDELAHILQRVSEWIRAHLCAGGSHHLSGRLAQSIEWPAQKGRKEGRLYSVGALGSFGALSIYLTWRAGIFQQNSAAAAADDQLHAGWLPKVRAVREPLRFREQQPTWSIVDSRARLAARSIDLILLIALLLPMRAAELESRLALAERRPCKSDCAGHCVIPQLRQDPIRCGDAIRYQARLEIPSPN